ncbi:hypothetical protein HPB52_022516 [Rhipicephalus sanguineus]|uniref:P-type domain-containing protein n=1 Tax=Rhipicephalus sanguineus TaxID=34632 RepID=A0A9D4PYW1_RHISA|nr:hypothetical protein HPB52_022516 [Rhipicephalus sanguineus]
MASSTFSYCPSRAAEAKKGLQDSSLELLASIPEESSLSRSSGHLHRSLRGPLLCALVSLLLSVTVLASCAVLVYVEVYYRSSFPLRVDCNLDPTTGGLADYGRCIRRGCKYVSTDSTMPACFFPEEYGYVTESEERHADGSGFTARLKRPDSPPLFGEEFNDVAVNVSFLTPSRLRVQLILDQQPLHETSNLRVLGLEIHATGSAGPWVKSAKQQASETIHLIRRIAKKSGGANSNMARLLVRSILQPRLVYRAQFHHLTLAEWARLEAINHEAMRAITGLPRITPLTVLQQESQLNTIDELVHQRRCARNLKPSTFCSVAALARYMGQEVHQSPSETSIIAPWNKMQLTENKPLGRLYNPVPRQANAQVSRLLRADHQDTATLVAYTDASVSGTTIHTALVCPSIPEACQTCSYFADPAPPAHLAELAAIRDGLAALIPFLIPDRCSQLLIRTDSTQAIHDIRRVYRSTSLSDSIHHLAASASPEKVITLRTTGGLLDFDIFLGDNPDDVLRQFTEDMSEPTYPPELNRSGIKCPENKWNNPPYPVGFQHWGRAMFENSVCGDANQSTGTHYNLHNLYGYHHSKTTWKKLLLPYIYTVFYEAHVMGGAVLRAPFYEFPTDPYAMNISYQFLWGSALLVSPRIQEDAPGVDAYFPAGQWCDFYTGESINLQRGGNVTLNSENAALHVRGGFIIPLLRPVDNQSSSVRKLELFVSPDENGEASGFLYWDDGITYCTHYVLNFAVVA